MGKRITGIIKTAALWISLLLASMLIASCSYEADTPSTKQEETESVRENTVSEETEKETEKQGSLPSIPALDTAGWFDISSVPAFSGDAYVAVNGNVPPFSQNELVAVSYGYYSSLDSLGRCRVCIACVGTDLMPTEERGDISSVKPTGWQSVKYDFIDGNYLYNRCHLVGYQLSGQNANEMNLITGTRYLNIEGMLPFENLVADYVKETENHVLYRITPVFEGENLVATGVLMEGKSVEDGGEGICFCVFCYNAQPGVVIDYATGDNWEEEAGEDEEETEGDGETGDAAAQVVKTYVLNTSSMKFHYPDCSSVADMSAANREEFEGTRETVIEKGYSPCGRCNP